MAEIIRRIDSDLSDLDEDPDTDITQNTTYNERGDQELQDHQVSCKSLYYNCTFCTGEKS